MNWPTPDRYSNFRRPQIGGPASSALPKGPTGMDQPIQYDTDDMMRRMTGDIPKAPPPFDLDAGLKQLGAPPQRPPLPQRPGPDRSFGSIASQLLAGASDVVGAGAGLRTGNLANVQGLQRAQADRQHQDALTQHAANVDNAQRHWGFGLQQLGMRQSAEREKYGRGLQNRDLTLREGGQKFGQEMATKGFERQGTWRTEDLLRDKERYGDTVKFRNEAVAEDKRRYDAGGNLRDFALASGKAKEAREQGMYDLQKPVLQKAANDALGSGGGIGAGLAGELLSGGEKNPSIEDLKANSQAEKKRILQGVLDGSIPRAQGEARIKEIEAALQHGIGTHEWDTNDAKRMLVYNTLRALLGEGLAGALAEEPTEGSPGYFQQKFEKSPLGKLRFFGGLPPISLE